MSWRFSRRACVRSEPAHLSAIYAFRKFVEVGGLMRYGETQLTDQFRQASFYVDRIRRRHDAEARTSRAVRSPGCRSLPAAGLERCHCLRLPRICHPQLEPMASRDRGHSLLAWCALSCLAAPALSQRDLAWFCTARGKLPLFGGPRLLALGVSGFSRLYVKKPSADACAVASDSIDRTVEVI